MTQPYRTAIFALGTIALLSLSNCTANQAASKMPVPPGNSSSTLAQNSDTAAATSTASPKTSLAYKTNNLLSNKQKAQLAQLGIPIVVPTYLPAGFRLSELPTLPLRVSVGFQLHSPLPLTLTSRRSYTSSIGRDGVPSAHR